jgi:hypothetical protein
MRPSILLTLALVALALAACAPEIGDACSSSVECPQDATCDTTATNGYCLIFECEDRGCPDNSVCVHFDTFSACMRHCESNGDCRTADGMVCRRDRLPVGFCYHPGVAP